jgi:DNA-binding transcriptional LysR family regulator
MPIDLRHLRIFVGAAECGSFSSAALQLNLEISAVSRAVRDIEDSLGVALFERLPRGVRLTVAGEHYLISARDILALTLRAHQEARIAASGAAGTISLGFVWSFTLTPMLQLLGRFAAAHPAIMLNLIEDGHDSLLARIRSGELHIALTATDPAPHAPLKVHEDLESLPLWLERLAVAVPISEQAESFTWPDLAGRWLLCRPSDDWRRFVTHIERLGGPTVTISGAGRQWRGHTGSC